MAMTSPQFDHAKLDRVEEGDKPRGKAVRRNLFGPVDHQQLQQDLNRLLCMGAEVAEQRWNFDFGSDHPTPGSVKWEEMQCQDVPAFYRSCVVRAGKRRPEVPISAGGEQLNTNRLLSQFTGTGFGECTYSMRFLAVAVSTVHYDSLRGFGAVSTFPSFRAGLRESLRTLQNFVELQRNVGGQSR